MEPYTDWKVVFFMFILLLIFFIVFAISFVFLFYKIKCIEEDIEALYDTYFHFIEYSFRKDDKNVA